MKFLNKLYTKAIFSEDPALNIVASDMGENMISLSLNEDIVKRLNTAVGTVGSLAIFVPCQVSLSLLKTSPAALTYLGRVRTNGYIGGNVTIYDDTNNPWTIEDISFTTADEVSTNGSDPQVTIRLDGNVLVNTESLKGF